MPTSGGKPKTCKLIEGFKGHPPHFVGPKQVSYVGHDGAPSVFFLARNFTAVKIPTSSENSLKKIMA
jgi:hypothetical protein